ncbi:3-deoxy-D-manno-octulosonic acid transferase [Candidatus Pelagibacter sp.]|nr:3-deoxy-D-manno-octulosonic acid transferase [Candidatus Pelagibacter sp.]
MILIYRLLLNLVLIFSPLIILIRLIKKKEHPIRFKEKFSFFSKKKKGDKLIWFHGASVGELMSIIPLIEKLEKNKKIDQILITTNTLSSAKIFYKFKFKKTIHQFFPIDTNYLSKKFLTYWKPSLAIFIDSEIWPNMLINLKSASISHILLNARVTNKSFKRWKTLGLFSKNLFKSFDYTYPSNDETRKYLENLNVKKIKKLGNLKFSENIFDSNKPININFKNFLKNKKHWCAASTHEGEELILAGVHLNLKKKFSNLLTIIIPRNIQRTQDITDIFSKLGLNTHLHSLNKKIPKNTQVYIVDTYGDAKAFFKICKIVFLGKSLTIQGGQNPLEPARYNCSIIHGPKVSNFKEIYQLLNRKKISFKVNNQNQLTKKINELLKKDIKSKNVGKRLDLMGDRILKKTLIELKKFI